MAGAAASCHGDQSVRVAGKVFAYLASLDLHVADLASTYMHCVHLKHALGYIQANNLLAVEGADDLPDASGLTRPGVIANPIRKPSQRVANPS